MKTLLLVLSISITTSICTESLAQIPGVFNYQAVVRDANGQGVSGQQVDIRFQIYDDPVDGSVIFVEEFSMVPTGNLGVLNLQIGRNGSIDLRELDWSTTTYFVNIQMRRSGSGSDYTNISGMRMQLVSVPMAFFASVSDTSRYASIAGIADKATLTDTAKYALSSGIITDNTLKGTGIGTDSLGIARMGAQQGQVLSWNNDRWLPSTINSGGGAVLTDQSTLTGDGTVSSPLRIRNLGVTNLEVANNAITSGKIADGEVEANDLSDMGALVGDILVYRPNGWSAEEPPASSLSPWIKEGNKVFVNDGEFVGINTSDPQYSGLSIYDGSLAINSPQQVVTSSLLMNPGNLEISTSNSIISSSLMNLAAGGLDISTFGFSGGQTSGEIHINPYEILLQSGENQASVQTAFHTNGGGSGYVNVAGPNGNRNARLTNILDSPDHGAVAVYDEFDVYKAGLFVNPDGDGEIFATVKNFKMQNPRDPGTDIWYACIEGPEAAAYERGTATLINGEVFVPFSEHFQMVVNAQTLTVSLTPHSSDTYGVAVVEKLKTGIRVKELKAGTSSYSFDWEVKGVRQGFENYQVIRDKNYVRFE